MAKRKPTAAKVQAAYEALPLEEKKLFVGWLCEQPEPGINGLLDALHEIIGGQHAELMTYLPPAYRLQNDVIHEYKQLVLNNQPHKQGDVWAVLRKKYPTLKPGYVGKILNDWKQGRLAKKPKKVLQPL